MSSVAQQLSRQQFAKQLAFGQIAETDIARWLISRGSYVLPVYDVEIDYGKGPRIFGKDTEIVAPDLLVISRNHSVCWIEAKHKTVFSWHENGQCWNTGIDRRHYYEYLRAADLVNWEVWLLFLHSSSQPDEKDLRNRRGCPSVCPTGLFGERLSVLKTCIHHEHRNGYGSTPFGRTGGVFWEHKRLRLLATLEEIRTIRDARNAERN